MKPNFASDTSLSGLWHFLPYQLRWLRDGSRLKIMEKSRQIGLSYATAYSAVRRAAAHDARLDVWVSSRDEFQAKLFLQDCKQWADLLWHVAVDLGIRLLEGDSRASAYTLQFANGRCIYSLSSNPNALAGKRGHVILDEFALHQDQALLYRVAKPVTLWGGQLEIISTHRGANSLFNRLLLDIQSGKASAGWSHHRVTLADAAAQGLVDRINRKNNGEETPESFVQRLHSECLSEDEWLQEYCCTPANEQCGFLTGELITACEEPDAGATTWSLEQLRMARNPLYLGVDVGRKHDLTVLDVGELIGDVMHDRFRLVLEHRSFDEIEHWLWRLLELSRLQRACLDATGMGLQLAERAQKRFGWKVEPITFTAPLKEQLAYVVRTGLEQRRLRLACDPALREDLLAVRKEVTTAGTLRFNGDASDGHCDRFWALALRQHAAARTNAFARPMFLD
ncbi:MAG: terminase family protein [Verrucomicrobiota bacterium]